MHGKRKISTERAVGSANLSSLIANMPASVTTLRKSAPLNASVSYTEIQHDGLKPLKAKSP
jgi:hypothetical protein